MAQLLCGGKTEFFNGLLIGALASEYLTKTYLEERPMDNPNSTLVAYKVFNETQNLPKSAAKTGSSAKFVG